MGYLDIDDSDAQPRSLPPRTRYSSEQPKSRVTGNYIKATVTRVYGNVAEFNLGSRDGLRNFDRLLIRRSGTGKDAYVGELTVNSVTANLSSGRCESTRLQVGDTVILLSDDR